MLKKFLVVCICTIFCIGVVILGCKKGCPTCKNYGYASGANESYQGYSQPTVQGPIYQVCLNNTCTCPAGQEGDSCQFYSINKYAIYPSPNWVVTDACSGDPSYTVNITTNPNNPYSSFYINNLFGSYQVLVNIQSAPNNTSSLVIQPQTIGAVSFYSFSGTYSLVSGLGKMTFTMDYNINGVDQNCVLYLYQEL